MIFRPGMENWCGKKKELKCLSRTNQGSNQIVINSRDLLTVNIIERIDGWFAAMETSVKSDPPTRQVILNPDRVSLDDFFEFIKQQFATKTRDPSKQQMDTISEPDNTYATTKPRMDDDGQIKDDAKITKKNA